MLSLSLKHALAYHTLSDLGLLRRMMEDQLVAEN